MDCHSSLRNLGLLEMFDLRHGLPPCSLTSRTEHPSEEQLPTQETGIDHPVSPPLNPRNGGIHGLGEGEGLANRCRHGSPRSLEGWVLIDRFDHRRVEERVVGHANVNTMVGR